MRDDAEKLSKVFESIFNVVKPWMNIDLWKAEQKAKDDPPVSSTYVEELRKRGATEEELSDAVARTSGSNEDDVDDEITVLKPT